MICNRLSFMFAFAFAFAFVGIFADEPEQIVNGIPTTIEENPHAVSLRINNKHFCGGSIIGPKHIITAGHCIQALRRSPSLIPAVTIVSGSTYLDKGGDVHKMDKYFLHEKYFDINLARPSGYDIGLIKLTRPIKFNQRQQAVALPRTDIGNKQPVTLIAWGTSYFGGPIHNDLRKLNANTMLHDECQKIQGSAMKIHQYEFCTLIASGTGACRGDSGSGVILNNDKTIVGLVSGGKPCARGYPDVFTTVFPFISWINGKMAL